MEEWEKVNGTTLHEKEECYSNLEDTTDASYMHMRRVCKDFEIKIQANIIICMLRVMHYLWLMFSKTS